MMVTEIPSYDEILGWTEEMLSSEDFTEIDEEMDPDEQLMLIALFVVLSNLYTDFEFKSFDYVLKNFPDKLESAKNKTIRLSNSELEKLTGDHRTAVLKEYLIPEKVMSKVKLDYNLKTIFDTLKSSVQATFNQLKDDVITKAKAFKAEMGKPDSFNLKSNFKRALKRTKNYVKSTAHYTKQKISRAVKKMVYGKDMLYYWVVAWKNTCKWCFANGRLPPRTIDEWPYDHVHGHCELQPASNETTDEYKSYLGKFTNIITPLE